MKIVVIAVLLFFASNAYGMSELEKAYKEKMESLAFNAYLVNMNLV